MSEQTDPPDGLVAQIMEQNLHEAIDNLIDEATNKIQILETDMRSNPDPTCNEQLNKLYESLNELQEMKREQTVPQAPLTE